MFNVLASACAFFKKWFTKPTRHFTTGHNDLRNEEGTHRNYMTPVDNQNAPINPCNSCTAFAVTATVEGTYNKSKWPNTLPLPGLDARKLFNTAGPALKCNASHWWPANALNSCKRDGLIQVAFPTKPPIKIADYTSLLGHNITQTKKAIRDHIDTTGPVAAVMVIYNDLYEWGEDWRRNNPPHTPNVKIYSPGAKRPYSGTVPQDVGIVGGHTLSIVGYDDASDYWICKNSWGDTWNGDGYVLIAQGKNADPALSSYIEVVNVWGVVI